LAQPSDFLAIATIAGGTGLGAAIDLWTRRVPNPLTMGLAATGVAYAVFGIGGLSIGASLAGLALGLALMLPGHLLGATGAGDVKLFAAAGALIGPASCRLHLHGSRRRRYSGCGFARKTPAPAHGREHGAVDRDSGRERAGN
jgi:Flp pilus assembly protein protease CpaA